MTQQSILVAFVFLLTVPGCDERAPEQAGTERAAAQPIDTRIQPSPRIDSMRARRNASLARRPDTLGMRADSGRVLGSPEAKLWVIVMSDFQCAPCREFALRVLPIFRKDFVDKGLVRLAFVNHPQDRHFNARFAATAALCASVAGRFWAMHDSLYSQQAVWERMTDPRPYMDSLAVAAGVAPAAQAACTSRNRMLHRLSLDIEQSRQSGVVDVPAVFVGDRRLELDELTYTGLREAVNKALSNR